MNKLAKVLLIATSLSPILGAVAINKLAHNEPWWWAWILVAILLVFLCWGLLKTMSVRLQKNSFTVSEFESNDSEILAFLLAYLLPFLTTNKLDFGGEWLTGAYIITTIFLVVMHADAFHFNPVMGILGYHFYRVKGNDGLSYLLITRSEIRRPGNVVVTVDLAHNIKLQIGAAS